MLAEEVKTESKIQHQPGHQDVAELGLISLDEADQARIGKKQPFQVRNPLGDILPRTS
jgi:hypothetical protein